MVNHGTSVTTWDGDKEARVQRVKPSDTLEHRRLFWMGDIKHNLVAADTYCVFLALRKRDWIVADFSPAPAELVLRALSKTLCFLLELSIKNLLLVLSDPGNTANRATVRTVGAPGG